MTAGRARATSTSYSVGFSARVVTVQSITADGQTAVTTDSQNNEVRVPLLVQPAKGALPQPGEQWVITQALGNWTFAAFAGTSASDFPSAGGTGGSSLIVSDTAPLHPGLGELWFNPNAGTLAIWTAKGWEVLQIGAAGIQPGSITSGQINPDAGITPGQVGFSINDLGGVKVTFGPTEPVSPSAGDLWFNPNAGYALTRWDGSSWVQYQFNAALALGPGTITAVQIAADAGISAGQVNFTASDIGGINTTVSSIPPASPNPGDLWYDGANGYQLNAWSGTAWVPVQFGTNAISAGSVTAALIAAGTITAAQIAAGAITATQIAAGTITATQIAASTIEAANIASNTITAAQIAANTITATEIAAATIEAANIAAGTIDSNLIAANAIAAGMIAAGAIDGMVINGIQINAGTIVAPDIVVSGDAGGLFVYSSGGTVVQTFTEPGTIPWICPDNVTSLKAECWGAAGGSAGGSPFSGGWGGDGAGGSEYACELTVGVTPGDTYYVNVGNGGAGGRGTSIGSPQNGSVGQVSTFAGDTLMVVANPGSPGLLFGSGGAGGTGSGNSIHFPGGAGAAGAANTGGGGGSSAGPGGPGNPASGRTGGAAVPDGGPGASTGSPTNGRSPTTGPGGGASGGGNKLSNGASGFAGQVRLTYTATSAALTGSITGAATTDPVSGDPVPEGAYFDNLATDNGITLRTNGAWAYPTLPSGASGLLRYRLVASPPNTCQIQCHLNFSPSVSGTVAVFTLPSGFIPTNQYRSGTGIFTSSSTAAGISSARFDVETSGAVQFLDAPAGTSELSCNEFVPLD